jgi:AraC-like DNA-binding protein/mannose-6-phosphate isomerase-like protein (cupin superfamily)
MKEYFIEKTKTALPQVGVEFFFQKVTTDCAVQAHIHSAIEILMIKSGSYRIFADDEEYIAKDGDMILLRSNTIHRVFKLSSGCGSYYVLKISPEFISELSSRENAVTYLLSLSVNNRFSKKLWTKAESEQNHMDTAIKRLIELGQLKNYCWDIEFKICASQLILIILRESGNAVHLETDSENLTRNIYDVMIYINKHYAEDLTAKDCSDMSYLSYSYFSRSFKNIVNMSFRDYLNLTRVNHAEKRLFSTDKTITQISRECGFNSVSYFISTYKKFKGKTPQKAREENGGNL